jgi:tetratricopeptide (TPR) repeat protein
MVRFVGAFVIAALFVLVPGPRIALACPAQPGSGAAETATLGAAPTAERAERVLREHDVVAEGRIEAIDALAERGALCQQTRAAIPAECHDDMGNAGCTASIRKIERFCSPRNAATISIENLWKGPAISSLDLHFRPLVTDVPCGGGFALKAGDRITLCARYDETGALNGYPCPAIDADVFDRFRSELAALQQAVDAVPDDVVRLGALAGFQEEWLDVTGALQSYAKLAELQPDAASGPAGIGRVLYAHGDIAGALPHLRRALKLDPKDTLAAELVKSGESALAPQ